MSLNPGNARTSCWVLKVSASGRERSENTYLLDHCIEEVCLSRRALQCLDHEGAEVRIPSVNENLAGLIKHGHDQSYELVQWPAKFSNNDAWDGRVRTLDMEVDVHELGDLRGGDSAQTSC